MCGIVSVFRPEGGPDLDALRRAADALAHRGPDGEGLWSSPQAAIAHRRLAILDLEGGLQPIEGETGCVAAVNGELYGHEAIRADLERRGHRFRTRTDSEITLHLYEEHGVDCLRRLRGEFALVIWDPGERRLFAARDRFGIKPLDYALHGGAVWVASEAKALLAAGVPARWDRDALALATAFQYPPGDRTLFAGIRQVPPGHYLLADASGVRLHRYWDLGGGTATGDLLAALEESVRLRLRADVPVCFHLSGGLDSSAILGLAARHMPKLRAFTVSFDRHDELPIAEETARHVGAELTPVRVTEADLVAALPDAVAASEGLAANGHLPAKYLLHREIRRAGFKVVLSGEGADEALAGYPHLRQDHDPARAAEIAAANPASAGLMIDSGGPPLETIGRELGFVPSFLRAKAALGARLRSLMRGEGPGIDHRAIEPLSDCAFPPPPPVGEVREGENSNGSITRSLNRAIPADLQSAFLDAFGRPRHELRVDRSLYLWTKSALATYILRTLGDGTEMPHSVEGRVPYLDHVFFEQAGALPVDLKIRGGVEKYALREAARPVLTETVYRRPKHPFVAPPIDVSALVRDLPVEPVFDRGRVAALLDRLPGLASAERAVWEPVVLTVASVGILQSRYRLGAP